MSIERKEVVIYRRGEPISTMVKDPVFGGIEKGWVSTQDAEKLFNRIEELEKRVKGLALSQCF